MLRVSAEQEGAGVPEPSQGEWQGRAGERAEESGPGEGTGPGEGAGPGRNGVSLRPPLAGGTCFNR